MSRSGFKQALKNIVKKIFSLCGLELRHRSALRADMPQVFRHLCGLGLQPQTVFDVGVGFGTFDLYEAFPAAKHILIEPVVEFEPALQEICRAFKAEYLIAAASDKAGEVVMNVHDFRLASSMFKEVEGPHVDGIQRTVPAVTIDGVCAQKGLEGPYVLKLDVHGAELRALDGARNVLEETELVIAETHLFQFFADGPQFYDVVRYMKERGFCVYDIFGQAYRPLDGALSSIDIAFVKEEGRFRASHFWANREQREEITRKLIGKQPACKNSAIA